nr:MAG TPA_asm: hypothetical protein [Caudoviricetes sp.]
MAVLDYREEKPRPGEICCSTHKKHSYLSQCSFPRVPTRVMTQWQKW